MCREFQPPPPSPIENRVHNASILNTTEATAAAVCVCVCVCVCVLCPCVSVCVCVCVMTEHSYFTNKIVHTTPKRVLLFFVVLNLETRKTSIHISHEQQWPTGE